MDAHLWMTENCMFSEGHKNSLRESLIFSGSFECYLREEWDHKSTPVLYEKGHRVWGPFFPYLFL